MALEQYAIFVTWRRKSQRTLNHKARNIHNFYKTIIILNISCWKQYLTFFIYNNYNINMPHSFKTSRNKAIQFGHSINRLVTSKSWFTCNLIECTGRYWPVHVYTNNCCFLTKTIWTEPVCYIFCNTDDLSLQMMNFLDVKDYDILGYVTPKILTELHVHLWDCAVDYR